ncbi:MAG: metallophosphoesterase [Candidatus Riflebacteria bacterium]|nr:metallophosphoesterase [Candidatus Riflebacteria bacterium]
MTAPPYSACPEVTVSGKLTVIGDLHGKLSALEAILAERRVEEELAAGRHDLVFLGDLVDRGPTTRIGDRIVHSGADIRMRGLGVGDTSCWEGQGSIMLTRSRLGLLRRLPVALRLRVGPTIAIVVHGGAPQTEFDLALLSNALDPYQALEVGAVQEMLWAVPSWSFRSFGIGLFYTELRVRRFLEANRARVLIRGHSNECEMVDLGDGFWHVCVHSAQGDLSRDDGNEGYVYLAWDAPAPPELVTRL